MRGYIYIIFWRKNGITLFRSITMFVELTTFYKIFLTFNLNDEMVCKILSVLHETLLWI